MQPDSRASYQHDNFVLSETNFCSKKTESSHFHSYVIQSDL